MYNLEPFGSSYQLLTAVMLDKEFFKDTLAGIIAGVIVGSGVIWWFWSYISEGLFLIFEMISEPVVIPEYGLFLVLILGAFVHWAGRYLIQHSKKDYKDIKKTKIDGLIWKWDYIGNTKDPNIESLIPICSECQSVMRLTDNEDEIFLSGNIPSTSSKDLEPQTTIRCTKNACPNSDIKNEYQIKSGFVKEAKKNVIFKIDRFLRQNNYKR